MHRRKFHALQEFEFVQVKEKAMVDKCLKRSTLSKASKNTLKWETLPKEVLVFFNNSWKQRNVFSRLRNGKL